MKHKWSVIALSLVLLNYPCAAATLLIPGDFATINEALAAAMPGDQLRLEAGRYVEPCLIIDKQLRIAGSGVNDTFLVGEYGTAIALVGQGDLTLLNLTVQSPHGLKPILTAAGLSCLEMQSCVIHGNATGIGLYLSGNSRTMIMNSTIVSNRLGAVLAGSASAKIIASRILENVNHGLSVSDTANLVCENCEFRANSTAVLNQDESTMSAANSTFAENDVGVWGQGLSCTEIAQCSFSKNSVAILLEDNNTMTIHACIFDENNTDIFANPRLTCP